ncbi:MAG TPA: sensor histidine kinase [Gammaproteobacteria bacterium]|nr:sensor histidine kinase [Gammaproteobacteria bacterium]HDH17222.1 sensor histidine kinase [Gammaproteobacteria bacterium]HDZ79108.1 sensor histidine kinase [Gammaproteobacteria bacterium]
MNAVSTAFHSTNLDTGMNKEQTTATDSTSISPDYADSVTGVFLLAAFLSSLVIIIARIDNWNTSYITDFVALLAASSLIALTDALVLKIFNPFLKSLSTRAGLATAYLLLMVTTFTIGYVLYATVTGHWPLTAPSNRVLLSFLQIFVLATVNYAIVLMILLHRAKTNDIKNSFQAANLQVLQSRIRPHFMFNSMNSIAGLIRNNPEIAEQALQDLADLIRVLMADARKLVPLMAEIETSKQYLKIEKLRLGDRLSVHWHLKSIPKDCFVPSLILQPLLENAVYHGIEPSFGGGVIDIDMRSDMRRVQILIRNPLPEDGERSHRKGNQIAMDNIKQRLIQHFGEAASLSSGRRNTIHITKIIFPIVV